MESNTILIPYVGYVASYIFSSLIHQVMATHWTSVFVQMFVWNAPPPHLPFLKKTKDKEKNFKSIEADWVRV